MNHVVERRAYFYSASQRVYPPFPGNVGTRSMSPPPNTPSFSRSHRIHGEKNRRLKPVSVEKRRIRRARVATSPQKEKKQDLSEANDRGPLTARDDKWISGLDCKHSKPTRRRFLEHRRI